MHWVINRAKEILSAPRAAWEQIKTEPLSGPHILWRYVAPMAIVPAAAFYLRFFFGKGRIWVHFFSTAVYFLLCLALAPVGAHVLAVIGRKLAVEGESIDFQKLVAFSLTPAFLGGAFLLLPWLSGLTFLIAFYSLYLLNVGIPVLVRCPDEGALTFSVASMAVLYVLFVIAYAIPRTMMSLF